MKITIFLFIIIIIILIILSLILLNRIKSLLKKKQEIEQIINQWKEDILGYEAQEKEKQEHIQTINNNLSQMQQLMEEIQSNNKKTVEQAFESYAQVLDIKYQEVEGDFDEKLNTLNILFEEKQEEMRNKIEEYQQDLDKISSTRAATYEALRREKQIEEDKDNFRLDLDERALRDIKLLKSIKDELSNPITVDKIIWSNYYQPLAKVKFPKIAGKAVVCGVYKITNLETKEAYIGQSVDIVERWKQHCKNALGVGTSSATNKLYSSMQKYGLYNFTFELLEECKSAELDEKEKFYISLYDTYNFGLNGTKGNS